MKSGDDRVMLDPYDQRQEEIFDRWCLAVETSNVPYLIKNMKSDELELMVKYIRRLKERERIKVTRRRKRKSPQEFDFALQEIEKITRGLELTSIEAIGVLDMVKQSFIEEMFYEDYSEEEEGSGEDEPES